MLRQPAAPLSGLTQLPAPCLLPPGCASAGESKVLLCVTPADQDFSTAEAFLLAGEVDPEGRRTLGVVSKIDKWAASVRHAVPFVRCWRLCSPSLRRRARHDSFAGCLAGMRGAACAMGESG